MAETVLGNLDVVLGRDPHEQHDVKRARHILLPHARVVPARAPRDQLHQVPQQLREIAGAVVRR